MRSKSIIRNSRPLFLVMCLPDRQMTTRTRRPPRIPVLSGSKQRGVDSEASTFGGRSVWLSAHGQAGFDERHARSCRRPRTFGLRR